MFLPFCSLFLYTNSNHLLQISKFSTPLNQILHVFFFFLFSSHSNEQPIRRDHIA